MGIFSFIHEKSSSHTWEDFGLVMNFFLQGLKKRLHSDPWPQNCTTKFVLFPAVVSEQKLQQGWPGLPGAVCPVPHSISRFPGATASSGHGEAAQENGFVPNNDTLETHVDYLFQSCANLGAQWCSTNPEYPRRKYGSYRGEGYNRQCKVINWDGRDSRYVRKKKYSLFGMSGTGIGCQGGGESPSLGMLRCLDLAFVAVV